MAIAFSLNPSSSLSLFRPKSPTRFSSSPSGIKIMKHQPSMEVFHTLTLPRKLVFRHRFACHPRISFKCFSQRQSTEQIEQAKEEEVYEFERLFSNLNQATLKREPGNYFFFTCA